MVLSALWFLLATFVIIPRHASSAYGDAASVYFQRYGELGDSVADILRSLLTRPGLVWRTVTEPLRLRYLAGLLASVGFLPLLAPEILLLGAPLLVANLLSSYAAQYSGAFHYSAPLVPYLVIGAVIGSRRLAQWTTTRWRMGTSSSRALTRHWSCLIVWLLAWSVGWQVAQGYTPIGSKFRWPAVTDHHRLLARFTAQIPSQTPGSATSALFPHLSHREKLYHFPHIGDAEWALLDVSGATDMHPAALRDQVFSMLDSGEWGVQDGADGYLLLVRGEERTQIPDSFHDFARSKNPQPQHPVSLSFGAPGGSSEIGLLQFLGYDVIDDEQWRLTSVRTYWQAKGPLPDVRILPFFVAEDGTVVEDTVERTPVGPLWYPPQLWSANETIVIDTLPWFLPNQWGLGVGVTQGESWEQRDRRWQVMDTSSADTFDRSTWALLGVYERRGRILREIEDQGGDQPQVKFAADFAGQLQLLGHSRLPETVAAGSSIHLQMLWLAPQPPAIDYSLFLHVRDEGNRTVTQWDGQPTWYGEQPTASWTPGHPMRSAHTLHPPSDLPPGDHRLVAGVYDWRTAKRLPLLNQNGQVSGEELDLGGVRIQARTGPAAPTDLCCALVPECCVSQERR